MREPVTARVDEHIPTVQVANSSRRPGPLAMLSILSFGHLLNDLYSNFLPQLLPSLLVMIPGFTATQAALLVASFNIASSLFQPIFGFMVDGRGHSWLIYVGTLWMSIFLSMTGLMHSYLPLVALAVAAGLGTAAFHPPASALVHGLHPRYKAVFQSAFVASGNFGFALAPLILIPLFQTYSLKATLFLLIPGILAAAVLFLALPRQRRIVEDAATLPQVWASIRKAGRGIGIILGVICVRQAGYTGLLALLPLYFHSRDVSTIVSSRMMTLMLFTGAFGGIAGGFISDRWGRRPLIATSLMLATPLFFGFLFTQGTLSLVLLALAGAALMSSFSVTTVAAQEAIPEHKAMAAGLTFGFSSGLGAIAVIFIGRLADAWGLQSAVMLLVSLPFVAGLLALFFRSNKPSIALRSRK